MMTKVLFATSEIFPLVKTGGLGDISSSLPKSLNSLSQDVRVIIPGYLSVLEQVENPRKVADVQGFMIPEGTCLLETTVPDTDIKLWIVDSPQYFERTGGPYVDTCQQEWPDNAHRFTMFCRVVTEIAINNVSVGWQPDVVHCNDWQTGLVPAFLSLYEDRPASVFTIHNLAYQGNFDRHIFDQLVLPDYWWNVDAVEFYHNMSFLKAGIVFSDRITTVSPSYAQEILQPENGFGMDGLLRRHKDKLSGILNGVDYEVWSPEGDSLIKANYGVDNLEEKAKNKLDLQQISGLKRLKGTLLIGMVCRLAHQKGIDYLIQSIKDTLHLKVQWVLLGSGEEYFENELMALANERPEKISFTIGYNESLSHKIEAGSDAFVMASRYEPCGLNQIYSLKYGTLPIVRNTGGLADTVVNVSEQSVADGTASGFVFEQADAASLTDAVERAIIFFRKKKKWHSVQKNAMSQDFSWDQSARAYVDIYENVLINSQVSTETVA